MIIFNISLNVYLYVKDKLLFLEVIIFSPPWGLRFTMLVIYYLGVPVSFLFLGLSTVPIFIILTSIYNIVIYSLYLKKLLIRDRDTTKSNKNFINNTKNIVIVNISLNSLMIIVSIIFLIILNKNNII